MSIHAALYHKTEYLYDRAVSHAPHVVRLRPAPHCRPKVLSYSLTITGGNHFINWQQDPFSNWNARLVFPDKLRRLCLEVELVVEMAVYNPFDFFLEESAAHFPFVYAEALKKDLGPFLELCPGDAAFNEYVNALRRDLLESAPKDKPLRTIDFLVALNQRLQRAIKYLIRLEAGVQSPPETLEKRSGSCRDSAWLLAQLLRHLGLASRFVSGYLIQLAPDLKSLDGPSGPAQDFTDLHAWAEVYLPGAGWVGLDPTSGLLAGEGHIPLSCTPEPATAAPVTGAVDECKAELHHQMRVSRIYESPRVTKPYSEEQWQRINALGHALDQDLAQLDVRLTMGGEPTFVSSDDPDGVEWNFTASSPKKRVLAGALLRRLRQRFAPGGLLHFGQGKWYPGEALPRWALACYWRKDGVPVWKDDSLIADESKDYGHGAREARELILRIARLLGVESRWLLTGYEDVFYYTWKERRLPCNVTPEKSNLKNPEERERLARLFQRGLGQPAGYALPLKRAGSDAQSGWISGPWFLRDQEVLWLIPGDSPMGLRLPIDSIAWVAQEEYPWTFQPDPGKKLPPLPVEFERLMPGRRQVPGLAALAPTALPGSAAVPAGRQGASPYRELQDRERVRRGELETGSAGPPAVLSAIALAKAEALAKAGASPYQAFVPGHAAPAPTTFNPQGQKWQEGPPQPSGPEEEVTRSPAQQQSASWIIRTALCVEPRQGRLHVFVPPVAVTEDYLELVGSIESAVAALGVPVIIEGEAPPKDPRLNKLAVTPDPGVIEVNVHPSQTWEELVERTEGLYEEARQSRLRAEKFMLDGKHAGTGGGNHLVLGGPTAADSPILRRPDLLRSLLAYWQNHPSLSWLFSGLFIGPTSQAPRVDEARQDSLYEIELAFQQTPGPARPAPPWLVDRLFRHLLIDPGGNTHRAEFCIDKLFPPDSAAHRLGLVEMRAFEMPPHARMSAVQQLLVRALVAKFWKTPYSQKLVRWGNDIHDRWLLPHFCQTDFEDVLADLRQAGHELESQWFAPHFEFRFPRIGHFAQRGIEVELRAALEPWHVLGEEAGPGATVRYVDSSLERLEVKARGMTGERFAITCNGRRVPLHPTGVNGEFVAGVRYRAWHPPECLQPTIGVHTPLIFDLYDTWNERSLGGCTYHVAHPGGLSYATFPINAFEAESRRLSRFFVHGHKQGRFIPPQESVNPDFPFTLDLRREQV